MKTCLLFPAVALLTACSAPDHPTTTPAVRPPAVATAVPDTAAGYAFLRQHMRLTFEDAPDVRGDDGAFFSRHPYSYDAGLAEKLVPALDTVRHTFFVGGFIATPLPVLQEFRRQLLLLSRRPPRPDSWDAQQLGQFVFVDSTGARLDPALASQVRLVSPARQRELRQAIVEWNRSPVADRFFSYASRPLFAEGGRYVLIVRGQAQQSMGWDSIFIYERTSKGWKILDTAPISTI